MYICIYILIYLGIHVYSLFILRDLACFLSNLTAMYVGVKILNYI